MTMNMLSSNHQALIFATRKADLIQLAPLGHLRASVASFAEGKVFTEVDSSWQEAGTQIEIEDDGIRDGDLVTVTLETMYRDGDNYKAYGREAFQGAFHMAHIDLIVTALLAGDLDAFVPSEVGLTCLPEAEGWEYNPYDPESQDVIWHTLERLHIARHAGSSSAEDLDGLLENCKRVITQGGYTLDPGVSGW